MGVHGGAAGIRHSPLHSHQRLRNRRGCHHRRPHRIPDGGVSGKTRAEAREGRDADGGEPASRHPVGCVRPRRDAGARARYPQGVPPAGRRKPAGRDHCPRGHDPAVHHQGLGHGARSRSEGIRGCFPCARRNTGRDLSARVGSRGKKRHRGSGRPRRRQGNRRGNGSHDGLRQRLQHALAL